MIPKSVKKGGGNELSLEQIRNTKLRIFDKNAKNRAILLRQCPAKPSKPWTPARRFRLQSCGEWRGYQNKSWFTAHNENQHIVANIFPEDTADFTDIDVFLLTHGKLLVWHQGILPFYSALRTGDDRCKSYSIHEVNQQYIMIIWYVMWILELLSI